MNLTTSILLYAIHILVLPLLLIGLLRRVKARLQNRCGPPLMQPVWDLFKLLKKGETVSETATAVFRYAPLINLGTTFAVSLMIPWLGVPSPIAGDLFLIVYVIAAGKFCMSLSGLDTGSAFGAIGSSREAAIGLMVEPALLLGLAALAVHAHSSSMSVILAPGANGHAPILVFLLVIAVWMCVTADLARMPVDDPTTHLELTMIHEAMILENSGRNLAFIEYAVALKTAVMLGLVCRIVMLMFPAQPPVVSYLISMGLLAGSFAFLAVIESVLVKLRWRRLPNFLSYAIGASILACLFVVVEG